MQKNYNSVIIYLPSWCYKAVVFLLWNTKEDILKNTGNQNVLVTIDFNDLDKKDISK